MKFQINRNVLSAALAKLFAVTPTKHPKEILRYIKAVVKGNKLTLLATDEEISMEIVLDLEDCEEGVCLLSQKISTICREVQSELITLDLLANQQIQVLTESGKWSLQTDDPSLFPEFPKLTADTIHYTSKVFVKAVSRTIFAADVDSTRFALGGILLQKTDDKLVFAATDGRRLSVHKTEGDFRAVEDYRVVVPLRAMRSALALCEFGETIQIRHGSNAVEFVCGESRIYSRLVEGRFPKWEDVIPDEMNVEFSTVSGPFLSAIRQSMIVTNEESRGVEFSFSEGVLTLQSEGASIGKSKVSVPVVGQDVIKVSLDPKFVADLLKTLESTEQVVIQAVDGNSAIKVLADGTIYVVMPLTKS